MNHLRAQAQRNCEKLWQLRCYRNFGSFAIGGNQDSIWNQVEDAKTKIDIPSALTIMLLPVFLYSHIVNAEPTESANHVDTMTSRLLTSKSSSGKTDFSTRSGLKKTIFSLPHSGPDETASDSESDSDDTGKAKLCQSVSVFSARGPRPSMEDEYVASRDNAVFGVFDGHGGSKVSKIAAGSFYDILYETLLWTMKEKEPTTSLVKENLEFCLSKTFEIISNAIYKQKRLDMQGSTAVTVVLQDDRITCANLGDSRAVLSRAGQAIDLSDDHKPNSPSEMKRIQELGGTVRWYGYLGPDRQPVPNMGAYRINGNLAVSRAFGDRLECPYVSAVPEIKHFERDPDDHFIILASDGLWDVMTSQDAVDFVQQILSGSVGALREGGSGGSMPFRKPSKSLTQWTRGHTGDRGMLRAVIDTRRSKMAQYLVEESLRRGTADNVTVVVVWFR